MFFIHAPCFFECILFYVSFIWLHVYVFAIHFMVHCGSAFEPGASGLPYYCTSICVRSWCNWRASLWIRNPKKKCRVPVRVPHAPIWEEGSCTYCAEQVTVQGGGGTGGADLACCPILLVNRCDAKRPVRWSCANRPSPSCSGQRRATCRCRLRQP